MEAAEDFKEKRKHPRFDLKLPLEYQTPDNLQVHGAVVVNASESGFLVHSIKDLPIGTKLNIAVLFLNGLEFSNFKVLAEIVWKDTYWEENREAFQFGLKFIDIPEEDHRKLKQLLGDGHGI